MSNIAVEFKNISKSFPGVKALEDVSFQIQKGQVHALLGENGAGKSTLLNILHGVFGQSEGIVCIKGQKVEFKNTYDAIKFGVAKVHQEVSIIEELTIGQNISLGYEPKKGLLIDYKRLHENANKILDKLGCKFRSQDSIKLLSTGELQMISIAKALFHNADIISFDEPTASLSNKEVLALFKIIEELKKNNITIIYVSHRLEEIFKICDQATILRDGKFVKTENIASLTKEELIRNMVGRDVALFAKRHDERQIKDEVVLKVKDLEIKDVFKEISFELRKGEILGFSGLVGSKRTDVVRAIFGADQITKGEIFVKGQLKNISSPQKALKNGIGLIPENRKTQGFVKYLSNADNIGLTCLEKFTKHGFVSHKKKRENYDFFAEEIDLNPKNPNYLTNNLSGGNQQKIILAKWLSTNVDILIFDEPTKGVDVGAKAEIYRLFEELVKKGKSIIMVSSELTEIMGMSDRVIIMKEGRIVAEISESEMSEEKILYYAMEGKK
ncbi:MAG: sugar ABC transporter ATP-binding protein [Firmicutes bacterium HGW-Firmicutes-1]|jgi:ribose transport system ATP-binding protein|nr:MAG: sugar ABC transporter ATP-binding protein [Firmicutes bacterium HGW-Firmicutes-1]